MVTQDRSVYPFTKQGEETLNKIRKLGTYILRVSISGLFSKVQHIFFNHFDPNTHIHGVGLTSSIYDICVLFPVHSLLPAPLCLACSSCDVSRVSEEFLLCAWVPICI